MKKIFLLVLILCSFKYSQAQISITISTDKKIKSIVQQNSKGDKEMNKLIINSTSDNKQNVVIRPEQPSIFSFGKGSKIPLKNGVNTFEFNSTGIVKGYGDNKQHLSLPFEFTVIDEKDSVIKKETVTALKTDAKPKTDTEPAKSESADTISELPPPIEKDSLTGIPFYDAYYLLNYEVIGKTQFEKILNYYIQKNGLSGQDLIDAYSTNLFLKDFIEKAEAEFEAETVSGNFSDLVSKGISSIGGLDVTNIADAFAKFIVKRTKQELNIAFFARFKEFISKYPDLRTVFPQTYNALSIIGDEIYNYTAYIQTLRESFENDLSTLDKNLPTIIDNHPDFFNQRPQLAVTLNSGSYIAGALEDKVHPGDILKDFSTDDKYWQDDKLQNWKGAIQTLQTFFCIFKRYCNQYRFGLLGRY